MDRRAYMIGSGSLLTSVLGGCFGNSATATEITPPEITAEDYSIENPPTTFHIEWNATAATEFDMDPHDGRSVSASEGMVYLVVAIAVTNAGENSFQFFPSGLVIQANDGTYTRDALRYIPHQFPPEGDINPNETYQGWLPYEIPRDATSVTLRLDGGRYAEDPAVTFERDTEMELPF